MSFALLGLILTAYMNYPPHLITVATLPCESWNKWLKSCSGCWELNTTFTVLTTFEVVKTRLEILMNTQQQQQQSI